MAKTLFDKIWDQHVIEELPGGVSLLHVDRHLMHELTSVAAIRQLEARGAKVHDPSLTFATLDHVISTRPGRTAGDEAWSTIAIKTLREQTGRLSITRFDVDDGRQGIVHVIGPELGLTLPGVLLVCADSHTCTHGALGAIAFGIGSTEQVHVLATQTIRQKRPKTLRVRFEGATRPGVEAKDMILYLIGALGTSGGTGYAIEYAGQAIRALPVEARLTLCNLSIELGAKIGMIAPDDVTFAYIEGRDYAPAGAALDKAIAQWRELASTDDAVFDKEITIDATLIRPQITWGTSPEHVIAIDAQVPDPLSEADPVRRESLKTALAYMQLTPGQRLDQTPIDRVFIGSCTNSRLSDLRNAAQVVKGRHVAAHVTAWVVPGSIEVKRDAEREGLDQIFLDAGFEWREPGCSMCVGANGDMVGPGERCVSTSNRNFVGRQGPGALTHLASPRVAAASAIAGRIAMLAGEE
ncbi:3-isopropylmalate dehydratase large subunit [Caballeronia sordidicola]|uniref:3-isopropylmalate dehydratase large subunit n=1 Tax=Caballeronia sordidicola TaxID=196367 RepID=A0A226WQS6_CABSO|nr:3-isopropylmalate dehydratase large subunit [Caballeronia sordidicola]OXC73159.1 3-isopropylmalate dehydratase large subunit [Caballeronia sordidicola]